jgi:hypothetical protein
MNDRSATTTSGGGATRAGSSVRTFTRSSTVTRSSVRSGQASWPYPTSAATTCAAPARSRTSVKPPVDAPASRQRLPATSKPGNAARAPASLCPPRDTYCGPASASSATVTGASLVTWVAGLDATWPPTATRPAAISSAACSRDLARPRRTSSASSLPRTVTPAGQVRQALADPALAWRPHPARPAHRAGLARLAGRGRQVQACQGRRARRVSRAAGRGLLQVRQAVRRVPRPQARRARRWPRRREGHRWGREQAELVLNPWFLLSPPLPRSPGCSCGTLPSRVNGTAQGGARRT